MKRGARRKSRRRHVKRSRRHVKTPLLLHPVVLISAFLLLLVVVITFTAPFTIRPAHTGNIVSEPPPMDVELFIDPLNRQSAGLMNLLIELNQRFKGRLDLDITYLVSPESRREAKYQLCIPDETERMSYIYCFNHERSETEKDMCKATIIGENLSSCIDGEIANRLLAQHRDRAHDYGVASVPTIFIENRRYSGDRSESGLTLEICKRITLPPPICSVIPQCDSDRDCEPRKGMLARCEKPGWSSSECSYAPVDAVQLTVISCPSCDTERVLSTLGATFGEIDVEMLDVRSGAGLIEEHGIRMLPAYLLPISVETHQNFYKLETALTESGDYFLISDEASGATHPVS